MGVDDDPGMGVRAGRSGRAGKQQADQAGRPQQRAVPPTSTAGVAARLCGALLACLACALAMPVADAATFVLPEGGSNMVGQLRVVRVADPRNTLLDIARHYDLGYHEITAANPGVSVWLPGAGTRVVVPTEFILPPKPWTGVVVDVPRRRLYYFPVPRPGQRARVVTFPVGIARAGWPTPLGATRIIAKYKDPSWIVPKDIQQEHQAEGDVDFPSYFPPGPGNPMGMLAMQTGFPGIFIHGTDRPWGVGMQVSHGCVHLYPEDAAYLYPRLPVGTAVRVIDQPVLIGSRDGRLYVSVSSPVGDYPSTQSLATRAVGALASFRARHPQEVPARPPWRQLLAAVAARRIVPVPIGPGAATWDSRVAALTPTRYAWPPYGISANDAAAPPPGR